MEHEEILNLRQLGRRVERGGGVNQAWHMPTAGKKKKGTQRSASVLRNRLHSITCLRFRAQILPSAHAPLLRSCPGLKSLLPHHSNPVAQKTTTRSPSCAVGAGRGDEPRAWPCDRDHLNPNAKVLQRLVFRWR